ncbi:hypothetical protein SK128_001932 [Halocaridina rubra]|uniref:Uncharacterized protein n=1 Tax=Halocaridina rubra TaxID=373956 RepID=A0AAN8X909_HALRR
MVTPLTHPSRSVVLSVYRKSLGPCHPSIISPFLSHALYLLYPTEIPCASNAPSRHSFLVFLHLCPLSTPSLLVAPQSFFPYSKPTFNYAYINYIHDLLRALM